MAKSLLAVGNVVAFVYNGKNRLVRIGKSVPKKYINGWDYSVDDTLGGGYRTFSRNRMGYVSAPAQFNPVKV